ncbi:MAG: ketoacyl-ACP synthase III [Alphaproteobacteria bacterium]|jgi:3-oxoacyl-[acyl-carrier-protein] synthase-3|nr:ketoacyl-ACP synthase III [Alphaproteobacteria bacterium]MDG1664195.1 ketoacyl-ACP synthase III [Hyphomicrobiales bacterium]|tara:strand:- start:802 stop:1782 length:981 start_codon:yes stop_codon:yes gene_type:complete
MNIKNKTYKSIVSGIGASLPQEVVTNKDLSMRMDTSEEWIEERTGIKERRIASKDETTSSLGADAAQIAIDNSGLKNSDIDLIILATATPDNTFPASATLIQSSLGIERGYAYDMQAVCSGFVFAVEAADNAIKAGNIKNALVIGSETFSRILDWDDRATCVLFGDGAGAMVLSASSEDTNRGVLSNHLHSDGRYKDLLYVDGGPSTTNNVGYLRMDGKGVFKHAVQNLSSAIIEAIEYNNIAIEDIDWFVPHQANIRILEAVSKKVGLSRDKVIITVDKHANTSAASIPLALYDAVQKDKIKKGDLVLLEAMGGGFSWGSTLIRW